MNTEYTTPAQGKSFIPLVLISASMILFFGYQLQQISKDKDTISANSKQLDEFSQANMEKYQGDVAKAEQVVAALKKLGNDVYELSKTDDNAKQVVSNLDKVGIKFQGPPPGSAPASGQQP